MLWLKAEDSWGFFSGWDSNNYEWEVSANQSSWSGPLASKLRYTSLQQQGASRQTTSQMHSAGKLLETRSSQYPYDQQIKSS